MGHLYIITDFQIAPALAYDGGQAYSCGLIFDGRTAVWHTYFPPNEGFPPGFNLERAGQELIKPLFSGRSLADFHQLDAALDALMETVTYVADIAQPLLRREDLPLSRREILSGDLATDKIISPAPRRREEVTVTRLLPPSLRFALSQLLVKAGAFVWQKQIAATLCTLFDLDATWDWVGIHAEANFGTRLSRQLMRYPIASLGIVFQAADFFNDRQQLQGHIQQIHEYLHTDAGHNQQLALLIRTMPELLPSFNGNISDVMDLFVGLNSITRKRPVRFMDPLPLSDGEQAIADLSQLMASLKISTQGIQIVASSFVDSLAAVQEIVAAEGAEMVVLEVERLGSLSTLVTAVKVCHQAGIEVLLDGGRAEGTFLAHLALALQPALVHTSRTPTQSAGLITLYNEMAQTLTGLSLSV